MVVLLQATCGTATLEVTCPPAISMVVEAEVMEEEVRRLSSA